MDTYKNLMPHDTHSEGRAGLVDLSIIIVSWNTRELLRECLESVYRHTNGVSFEIFVVDNNSFDGSSEMVRELFPLAILIANKENAGFSKANNQAIRVSMGRYIALLNPDTLLTEDVFSPLVNCADQNKEIGAIGPKILRRDGQTIQYSCARRLPNLYFDFCRLSGLSKKFPETKIFGGEYISYWDHKTSRYVESLVGACMIVRAEAIHEAGMMDENQFMYGDEIDWCKRLLDAGWEIYYHAYASIIHFGAESSRQVKLTSNIEANKALVYFYRKHNGQLYALLFYLQVFFFNFSKYVWSILFRNKDDHVKELMVMYKNTYTWSINQILNREDQSFI